MKFKDFLLKEAKENHAVMAFGRMNPPTTGHEVLVNKVKDIANKVGGSHHIVLSHTNDKAKNPLTPEQKLKHARRFFPGTNLSLSDKESPNFLTQAAKLHKQGVTHLHMVAGSDRVPEYKKLLKKYNGTHPDALFNFKKITVHNAGQRDPDAEGTEGMSASKMRGHATSGNFDEFRKGIPSHVPTHHAKDLYNDVRKGMSVKEETETTVQTLDEEFKQVLFEGVHDRGIFKAVFLAGGPGSGKDYVLDNTLSGHGLTEINSDKALEFLMDKHGLDKTMPATETDKRDIVRGKAKNMTELRQRLALLGRNGLIINGTGDDHEKISRIKSKLEEIGYDTAMVMVNTADEVSKVRNIERGQRGGRTVPEEIRKNKWDSVQAARPELAKMFGDRYMEFDNSEDLRQAPPEVVKAKKDEMLNIFTTVQDFIKQPPQSEAAESWVATELHKKDTLPVPKDGHEQTPHPNSGAAEEARKLGLQYYGFGRYGKNGKVTYRSVHDKLVQVQQDQPKEPNIPVPGSSGKKPVNEEFEDFFAEDEVLVENNHNLDPKHLMKDKDGKVRKFMLRRAAAKEAHLNGGVVYKDGRNYVIKLKENQDVPSTNKLIQKQKARVPADSGDLRTVNITEGSGSCGATRGEDCDCGCSSGQEEKSYKGKITISQIRSKKKEAVKEAIDYGIEPGLSMAGAGESPARDMGEKWKKKTGKSSQVAEMQGDETGASIGAQKEDELKKKGINLSTFKAKNPV